MHSNRTDQPNKIRGARIAILPHPALGDITLYLHLAWAMHSAGARIKFVSDSLYPAREYFPWLDITPESGEGPAELAADFDLVIACFEKHYDRNLAARLSCGLENLALVTAKKIPPQLGVHGRGVRVRGHCFQGASRPFCSDSLAGLSMVDWVDAYARQVFGLDPGCAGPMPLQPRVDKSRNLVLIFPTTPQAKKNYWLRGFWLIGRMLDKRGWRLEFVGMPHEISHLQSALPGFQVRGFANLKELIDHVASASVVISNDSGGGHLASLLGLATYTITRRTERFPWRPGFNGRNTVIYPRFRFKLLGQRVWRPFVPIWRIGSLMGSPGPSPRENGYAADPAKPE